MLYNMKIILYIENLLYAYKLLDIHVQPNHKKRCKCLFNNTLNNLVHSQLYSKGPLSKRGNPAATSWDSAHHDLSYTNCTA